MLNSLAAEGMDRGLRLVRPGGHFVELGKQDLQTDRHLPMGSFAHHVSFHLVDLDTLTQRTPERAYSEFADVVAAVHSGVYRPLPYRGHPPDRVGESYELMAHSRHVGKVVISLDDEARVPLTEPVAPMRLDPAATYLVTGGTSGFGAATVQWLAERGARHLVAISRSGDTAPEAAATTAAVHAHGADLRVEAVDVTDQAAVADLIRDIDATGRPLRGVVHAAMVLRDAPLLDQDARALAEVVEPKVTGAEVLDRLTRDRQLDFFWLYSSLSGVVGTINQAGYAAANLHLEALARARRAAGLPALAVAWGSIGDTGYLARSPAEYTTGLLRPVTARSSLQALDKARDTAHAAIGLGRPDWSAAAGLLPGVAAARFGLVVTGAGTDAESAGRAARDAIRRAGAEHAVALTSDAVARVVAHVMQIAPERLDRKRPVHQLGLDSLLAVHVQAELWRVLRCELTSVRIMPSNGIDELAAAIYPQLAAESAGSAG
ncbi:SDR family NAD(P)-dependent oxidoreductase [Actinokineospora sp. 24-640]